MLLTNTLKGALPVPEVFVELPGELVLEGCPVLVGAVELMVNYCDMVCATG
jgi:hypothetical protein